MNILLKKKKISLVLALVMMLFTIMGVATKIYAVSDSEKAVVINNETSETTQEVVDEQEQDATEVNTTNDEIIKKVQPDKSTIVKNDLVKNLNATSFNLFLTIDVPNGETVILGEDNKFYFSSDRTLAIGEYSADTEIKGNMSGTSNIEVNGDSNIKKITGKILNIKGGGTLNVRDNISEYSAENTINVNDMTISGNTIVNLYEERETKAATINELKIESGSVLNIQADKANALKSNNINVKGTLKAKSVSKIAVMIINSLEIDGGTVEGISKDAGGIDTDARYQWYLNIIVKNNGKLVAEGDNSTGAIRATHLNASGNSEVYVDGNNGVWLNRNLNLKDSKLFINTKRANTPTNTGLYVGGSQFILDNSNIKIGEQSHSDLPYRGIITKGDVEIKIENNSEIKIYGSGVGMADNDGNVNFSMDNSKLFIYTTGAMGLNYRDENQNFNIKNGSKIDVSAEKEGFYLSDGILTLSGPQTQMNVEVTSQTSKVEYALNVSNGRHQDVGILTVEDGAQIFAKSSYWAVHAQNMIVTNGSKVEGISTGSGMGVQATYNMIVQGQGTQVKGVSAKGAGVRAMGGNLEVKDGAYVEGEVLSPLLTNNLFVNQNGIMARDEIIADNAKIVGKAIDWSNDNGAVLSENNKMTIKNNGEIFEEYKVAQEYNENYKVPFENIRTIKNFGTYNYQTSKGRVELDPSQGIKAIRPAEQVILSAIRTEDKADEIVRIENGGIHQISTQPVDLIADGEIFISVTFDSNGADKLATPETITIKYPENKIASLPEEPEKNGFEFTGWNTKKDGDGDLFDTNFQFEDDITVFAQWKNTNVDVPENPGTPDTPDIPENPEVPENPNTPNVIDGNQGAGTTQNNETQNENATNVQQATPIALTNEEVLQQIKEEGIPTFEIADREVPLQGGSNKQVWALVNLILAGVGLILSIIVAVVIFKNKKDKKETKHPFEIISIVVSLLAVIAFVITENMKYVMVLVDRWTILSAALILIQVSILMFAKVARKKENKNKDEVVSVN